jgi:hypothetical protein
MLGLLGRVSRRVGRATGAVAESARAEVAIALEAIRTIRDAEQDLRRAGQPALARAYAERAERLEQRLRSGHG